MRTAQAGGVGCICRMDIDGHTVPDRNKEYVSSRAPRWFIVVEKGMQVHRAGLLPSVSEYNKECKQTPRASCYQLPS